MENMDKGFTVLKSSKFIFDEKRLHWASVVRGTNQQVKAELLLLKLIHLFAREVLLVKKLEIEEKKRPPSIQLLKLI